MQKVGVSTVFWRLFPLMNRDLWMRDQPPQQTMGNLCAENVCSNSCLPETKKSEFTPENWFLKGSAFLFWVVCQWNQGWNFLLVLGSRWCRKKKLDHWPTPLVSGWSRSTSPFLKGRIGTWHINFENQSNPTREPCWIFFVENQRHRFERHP